MQVALVTGKREIQLVEMPDPKPDSGKAVVEISYCGICGTDLHAYLSGEPYNPAICGHEWVGAIRALGPGCSDSKEGDRVAIGVASACGQCATCRRGDASHCELVFAGATGLGPMASAHGGFASAIAIDHARLYQVPASLSDEDAAILEPATVAVHALRRTPMQLGDSVVVVGGGPIGLLVMQAARINGAGHVTLIEPEANRRQLAATLGANLVIDPTTSDSAATINEALGQAGADVVFECAGIPATIQQSVNLVRRGGVVSLVGFPSLPAEINAASWLVQEVRLTASLAYLREDFYITAQLVADGRLQCGPLHTSTVDLNGIRGAFEHLAANPEQVKVLVDPRG